MVGGGRIGSALFEYGGFRHRGFEIVAVLDADPAKVGTIWGDVVLSDISNLEAVLRAESVDIVVLTIPAEAVPDVLDRVVAGGVRGILNFAPVQLRVTSDVTVKDVHMVMELEALSFALSQTKGE